jgi:hypothetical protein
VTVLFERTITLLSSVSSPVCSLNALAGITQQPLFLPSVSK